MKENQLETGDILFEKSKKIYSRPIQWWTNSQYSHVAMVYEYPMIIQSRLFRGVHITHIDTLEEFDVYAMIEGLSGYQKNTLKEVSLKYLGLKYDLRQIFGYVNMSIIKGRNKLNNPHQIICSELIDLLYIELSVDLRRGIYLGDVTPADLTFSSFLKLKQ